MLKRGKSETASEDTAEKIVPTLNRKKIEDSARSEVRTTTMRIAVYTRYVLLVFETEGDKRELEPSK